MAWCADYERISLKKRLDSLRNSDFYFISRGAKGVACIKDLWSLFDGDAGLQGFVDFEDAEEVVRFVIETKIRGFAADNEYRLALEAGNLVYAVEIVTDGPTY